MTQIVIVRSAKSAVVGAGQGSPESDLLGTGKRPAEKVSMLLGLVAGVLPAVIAKGNTGPAQSAKVEAWTTLVNQRTINIKRDFLPLIQTP
jgi:hypothetical protein